MTQRYYALASIALCALLAACGSPIVGAECANGFVLCNGQCVDVANDPRHCGACEDSCGPFTCEESECTTERRPDAGGVDGGLTDSGQDGMDASDALDAGLGDAGLTPIGSGPFLPDGGLTFPDPDVDDGCPLGRTECNGACFDLQTSTAHCGACGTACASDQFCVLGMCEDRCEEPLVLCGDICVDVASDPEHCGNCSTVCASGICEEGVCADALPGHIVVLGHDYERTTETAQVIASNVLPLADPEVVRAVVYRGKAAAASANGVIAALGSGRVELRPIEASAGQITAGLVEANLFVIHAQRDATDAELIALGEQWGLALAQFVARGGVIVLFDTPSDRNAGTYQILMPSGLFVAESRIALPGSTSLRLSAPGDSVATGASTRYRSSRNTVAFMEIESDATVVVASPGGDAVVVHRAIVP